MSVDHEGQVEAPPPPELVFHANTEEEEEEEIYRTVDDEEPTVYCDICMESKPLEEMFFDISFCSHSFCNLCMGLYIVFKVEQNSISVRCPDPACKHGLLEPLRCRTVVAPEVIRRWEQILCEDEVDSLADHAEEVDRDEEEICRQVDEEELTVYCTICMESKPLEETFFGISFCSHSFCNACIGMYIVSMVEDNSVSIRCPDPDCKVGLLEPGWCRTVVAPEVIHRWEWVLCEESIGFKFYCPFRDCSAMLTDEQGGVGAAITEAECPHCHRMFCAACRVVWHADVTCEEFQKLGEDERGREDVMVMNMAKAQKWQRCPKCKFYVERTQGCLFIKCRCGHAFCYSCASPLGEDHNCIKCKR